MTAVSPSRTAGLEHRWQDLLLSAPAVTAFVFLLLLAGVGNRLVLDTNDEGIILDAAQRLIHGQRLYVDFFAYMSPGSYWIQEGAFRLLGVSMLAGRIPVLADVALQCGLVLWLARLLMHERAARACVVLFFALRCYDLTQLTAQHRMDSASLSLASLCCTIYGNRVRKWRWFALGGALIAAASICTPSIAAVALVIAVWMLMEKQTRVFLGAFLAGAAVAAVAALVALWEQGSVFAFLQQMLWLQGHYSNVNRMPYGSMFGGYRAFVGGGGASEAPVRAMIAFWLAVPAAVPLVAAGGARFLYRKLLSSGEALAASGIPLLVGSVLALVVSTYPRMDVAHLGYVLAVPFVLTFAVVNYLPSTKASTKAAKIVHIVLVVVLALGATTFLYIDVSQLVSERSLNTPVGHLRVGRKEWAAVRDLLATVTPDQTLYVHPYMPLLYFLTGARNPTRFSYLAPGMMTDAEANAALDALTPAPPQWLLYLRVDPTRYLRLFPSADPSRVQYPAIENWISQGYTTTDLAAVGDYTLFRRSARSLAP